MGPSNTAKLLEFTPTDPPPSMMRSLGGDRKHGDVGLHKIELASLRVAAAGQGIKYGNGVDCITMINRLLYTPILDLWCRKECEGR